MKTFGLCSHFLAKLIYMFGKKRTSQKSLFMCSIIFCTDAKIFVLYFNKRCFYGFSGKFIKIKVLIRVLKINLMITWEK